MKPGKDFEDRIRKRLERAGCHVVKLPDASAPFIRDEDGKTAKGGARFTSKNPYDLLVLRPARDAPQSLSAPYAMECKTTAGKTFTVATVKPHQLAGLLAFPWCAGVVVELRGLSRCFFVRAEVVAQWAEIAGKKSMNLDDLNGNATQLPVNTTGRESRTYYDVAGIFA